MKFSILMAAGTSLVAPLLAAGEKSGHAEAELIAGVISYQPGKPVPVGIKLKIEPGWHSYWVNPGVGGMAMSAKWTLPGGWSAGELKAPVPKRFKTGDLPGFGYEGEVIYRVDLTPPADAKGEVKVKVKLSWLTCNESACVPGDVEVSLQLPSGDGSASKDELALVGADTKIPDQEGIEGSSHVSEKDGQVVMAFTLPGIHDIEGCEVFPLTPQVVDPGSPIILKKAEQGWTATAPKDEYADGPVKALSLVLANGKNMKRPLIINLRAK
jgi:DsbC/DsbD-like thiol-disulfide interchange protein